MQTLDEKSAPQGGLVLLRRRPVRAVAVAAGFAALLALVPLTIAPGVGPLRVLTFAILAASSVALLRLGLSRAERTLLVRKPGGLVWGKAELGAPDCVALDGDGNEEPPLYRAVVRFAGGEERVALEHHDPARVLRDALALARRLDLELRPGWGLERHFSQTGFIGAWEDASRESSDAASSRGVIDLAVWPVQRKTATVCLASGVFVLAVTTVLARSPFRSVSPSALELVLTGLSSFVGIGLGTLFFGLRRRVKTSGGRLLSTFVFYGTRVGKEMELGPARARAFAVTPDSGFVRHVVFATATGPRAFAADPEGAERLATGGIEPALAERVASPARVTSARYRSPDRPARLRS